MNRVQMGAVRKSGLTGANFGRDRADPGQAMAGIRRNAADIA